jgi:hypothetical protein
MKDLADHSNGEEMKKDWRVGWLILLQSGHLQLLVSRWMFAGKKPYV